MKDELDDIRIRLAAAGKEYDASDAARSNARAQLEPLIREALEVGMSPGEVQRLSHLSHESVRIARIAAGLPPAPRGGRR